MAAPAPTFTAPPPWRRLALLGRVLDPSRRPVALWGVASAVFLLGRHGSVTDALEAAPDAPK